MPDLRTYEPVWLALKKNNQVSLSAPRQNHARIYKAVRKEKDMDTVFKLELADRGESARLSSESSGMILTIYLNIKLSGKFCSPNNLF